MIIYEGYTHSLKSSLDRVIEHCYRRKVDSFNAALNKEFKVVVARKKIEPMASFLHTYASLMRMLDS